MEKTILKIINEINSEEKSILNLISELVAQDTSNPPGEEHKVGKIVEKELKKYKIKYKKFEKVKGRPNILAYIGKGKPSLFIPTHMDTVPAGDHWNTNPFKVLKKGDFLYGLGVSDNKGPLACMLVLAKIIKKHEKNLKGQLILGFVSDEEKGSSYGMQFLLDKKLFKPNFAIVPDSPTSLKKISIGEKGRLEISITSHGKQGHASRPYEGLDNVCV